MLAALCLAFAGAGLAQTTAGSVEVRSFEILSVDGNRLVVRDQNGTQEYVVPEDFRFTVDGKPMSVHELEAGMKGVATVTTTTTVKPVVVTEVHEAEVLRAGDLSITVREGDSVRRFTQGQLDDKGVRMFKNGHPIRLADLHRGDHLTATIVTQAAPVVLTEQEVKAVLDEPAPAAAVQTAVGSTSTAVQPAPALAQPAPQPAPAETSAFGTVGWLLVVIVALAIFWVMRRRREN